MRDFNSMSINLHLFFLRIMKEHSLFLEAGFQGKDAEWIQRAEHFKVQFEKLLEEAVRMAGGNVSPEVLESEELVTPYTLHAERKTQQLTGIRINGNITLAQQRLGCRCRCRQRECLETEEIRKLNQNVLRVLGGLIEFKERILREVNNCRLFTANYPLLIQHILREARLYQSFLRELESTGTICQQSMRESELFWNQIMMEHALFIRGLLDPTEAELIETADGFAKEYERLLKAARDKNDCMMDGYTEKSREVTIRYRDFKEAGTQGISGCEISSLILPLLADHVLREANHYLRLLDD